MIRCCSRSLQNHRWKNGANIRRSPMKKSLQASELIVSKKWLSPVTLKTSLRALLSLRSACSLTVDADDLVAQRCSGEDWLPHRALAANLPTHGAHRTASRGSSGTAHSCHEAKLLADSLALASACVCWSVAVSFCHVFVVRLRPVLGVWLSRPRHGCINDVLHLFWTDVGIASDGVGRTGGSLTPHKHSEEPR